MDRYFEVTRPESDVEIPLVIDSPHSGTQLPVSFNTNAPHSALFSGWDAWIEDLYGDAPYFGATLMHQSVSRMVIDLNRKFDDISPDLVEGSIPDIEFKPTDYSNRGMGLIRRFALPGVPVHEGKVQAEDILERLQKYYTPYHTFLEDMLRKLRSSYGVVWHINCHSMKSLGNAMNVDSGATRPDIVLSDRDGTCGDPGLMQVVKDRFINLGYSVSVNDPYKGGYLVQAYSNPKTRVFSMQIEINRALYMDESRFVKGESYDGVKTDLNLVLDSVAAYIRHFSKFV